MPEDALTRVGTRSPLGEGAQMAPIAAAMYLAAALVVALSLLLPQPDDVNRIGLLLGSLSGALAAAAIWLLRDRLPAGFFHLSTAAGTALTGLCVYWSGEANSAYAWLLLWVAVFAAYFFTPLATFLHLSAAGAVYALALFASPHSESTAGLHWLLTMVAISVAAITILSLVQARRQLEAARERTLTDTIELARTDPLTGLLNRRAWHEQLEREIARSRRYGGGVCVAMLDLDHFKRFNDEHGHLAGDDLLRAVADAWTKALRPNDVVARYGGEEFAVLLPACDLEHAIEVIERLRTSVPMEQCCSAGVACWDGEELPMGLLARADARLYTAKNQGRDRLVALA